MTKTRSEAAGRPAWPAWPRIPPNPEGVFFLPVGFFIPVGKNTLTFSHSKTHQIADQEQFRPPPDEFIPCRWLLVKYAEFKFRSVKFELSNLIKLNQVTSGK